MDKVCEWCGATYKGTKVSRYCKEQHFKTCDNDECGKTFAIKNMKRPAKGCSKDCSDVLTKKNSLSVKVCEWCNKEFTATKKHARFCDDTHYSDCKICGERFVVTNVHKPAETCSKVCAWKLVEDVDAVVAKTKATMIERHGVANASQADFVKEKKRQAALEKYGVENVSQAKEVQEKRENTFLERYGETSPLLNEDVRDKIAATNIERYGVENVFANKEIQDKIKASMIEKYGVDNISKLESNRAKVRATTFERFGVESVLSLPENQLKSSLANGKRISKVNKGWQELIEKDLGVSFKFEQRFGDFYADLGFGDVLIDINPTATHNSTVAYAHLAGFCKVDECLKHLPTASSYHHKRALAAEAEGKVLLQFFDWYDPEIFLSILRSKLRMSKVTVYARKTVLKEISQSVANEFLRENHLLGASNKQSLCVGLFDGDELVHVQTYGESRFTNKAEWEAIRSASKVDHHVVGAFSKCDKYFFNKVNPESVVSYVDLSISHGATDSMFDGWVLDSINRSGAMWVRIVNNPAYPRFLRDSTVRRVSADRLLGFEVGDKYPRFDEAGEKISNSFVMISEGFVKVPDAGTKTFLWRSAN